MDPRIQLRLAKVSRRLRAVRTGWSLAGVWLLAALCGWFMFLAVRSGWPLLESPSAARTPLSEYLAIGCLVVAATAGLALVAWTGWRRPDYPRVVRRIERYFPDLEQRLLTASQLPTGPVDRPSGYLQRCVVSETIRHDVQYDWRSLVSSGRLVAAWSAQTLALVCLLATAWLLWTMPVKAPAEQFLANANGWGAVGPPIVEPGSTEIERGSSLIVTARFDRQMPDEVWLVQAAMDGRSAADRSRVRMRPALEDPIFAAYLSSVYEPLVYHIEYGSRVTSDYRVEVYDVPGVVRADAELVYPSYARQVDRSVLDTRRITVPEGTQVTWKLQLNKAVAVAELIDAEGVVVPLTSHAALPAEDSPPLVEAAVVLRESQHWLVRLVDAEGRSNASEIKLQAKVLPNQPAEIQLLAGGDARVSPLEEFGVSAKVSDDHAITSAGIAYQFGGREVVETIANSAEAAHDSRLSSASSDEEREGATDAAQLRSENQRQLTLSHRIDLETLQAQPNQLLSYYVWAEDIGPTGTVRRTESDIYFAEVRPFEEIFREGQQPTSDQQQQQQAGDPQTEELVELQKQIVVATWNLLRAERGTELLQTATSDLELLIQSQQSAAELLQDKAAELQDAQLGSFVDRASQAMRSAIAALASTRQSLERAELQAALGHAQAAYEALLQLQSREHQVVRGQRSQSQSASRSSAARQAQIEQLALSNDENRYENQRLAQSQEQQQQSDMRQINSRLRELAARQQDLNQQLRELQAGLQAAPTDQQQQELEQRLQRLREQQQQMLSDSDELSERMQNPAHESMQQAQQEMQQARDNMQRANEALGQDKPGQALAAGARAEQQMRDLQDALRRQSANQFQQSLQEMQQRAAEMEQRQNQLAQQLRGPAGSRPPADASTADAATADDARARGESPSEASQESHADRPAAGLRGEEPAQQQVADQVREQQSELQELLQQMEHTVNEAETTEPLLAQRLYDSYRGMQQNKTLERLQVTERLIERNLPQPARELAQTSAEELSELRQQIDRAAEAVLGSDVESLRLALGKLEALATELEAELPDQSSAGSPAASTPRDAPPTRTQTASSSASSSSSSSSSGEVGQGDQGGPRRQPGAAGPLTGDGFRGWSDTLRDVEELVGDAELRWQATEIRQAARELRGELKKHAAEPQWEAVQELVASPLRELKHQVADELLRRAADKTQIVPLDRDPVPGEFSRSVRQYFENLGSAQ